MMNPVLVKRLLKRLIPLLPFLLAIFGFHGYQALQRGESVSSVALIVGIPALLIGLIFTGLLWFLSRPVPDNSDPELAVEARRASLMRKVAIGSFLIHAVLAASLILGVR
jgi:predicted signal transduction protein with EAL and GGDEF domain